MNIPKRSKIIANINRAEDIRGDILSIVDCEISNVSLISCNPGSIRSNHYHKKDFHFMYVLEGEIDYFFKDILSKEICYLKVQRGQTIFTPKKELHATFFPVQSQLIVSSALPRDKKTYEEDTVREPFIDQSNIESFLDRFNNA